MAARQCTDELASLLAPYAGKVEADMRLWLIEDGVPPEVAQAMEYCALGGGKRLRPALLHMTAEAIGAKDPDELTRRAAVAVELVHCYSLVHDDLPSMDDDTLRRGRPTAHVRFGEAMAVLAGDALLTRAFGILSQCRDARCSLLIAELARASGAGGMIAGQAADMNLCDVPQGEQGLLFIHSRKTAAMIRAAARMGAICASAGPKQLAAAGEYGESLGLAFQLKDDLLDLTGSADQLGKTPGKDARTGKPSHAAEVGVTEAERIGKRLTYQAVQALGPLADAGRKLAELAGLLAERTH